MIMNHFEKKIIGYSAFQQFIILAKFIAIKISVTPYSVLWLRGCHHINYTKNHSKNSKKEENHETEVKAKSVKPIIILML